MTFEDAMAKTVNPQLTDEEARLLFDVAKDCKFIVEIGTLKGNSALILGATGNDVVTIDNYSSPNSSKSGAIDLLAGLENVRLLESESSATGEKYYGSIDLLFIDGGHDYEQVKADIEAWSYKVIGKIAFHDYGSWPGVTQAVDEAIEQGKLKKVEQAGTLIVTEK